MEGRIGQMFYVWCLILESRSHIEEEVEEQEQGKTAKLITKIKNIKFRDWNNTKKQKLNFTYNL